MRLSWLTTYSLLVLSSIPGMSCGRDSAFAEPDQPVGEAPVIEGDGQAGTITVSAGTTFQTMDGFGTTLKMWDDPHLNGLGSEATGGMIISDAQRDSIYDLLYSPTRGIGLNRLRVPMIAPGWQTAQNGPIVTDAPYPGPHGVKTIDFIVKAKARNPELQTFFEIVQYDSWIKKSEFPLVIARYIKSSLDYARVRGQEPDWVGIQNEPSISAPDFNGENLRDVTIELKNILKADKYSTRLTAPDDVNDSRGAQKSVTILEDPAARAGISALSVHLYSDETPTAMAALAKQYNLPLWMTEYYDLSADNQIGWASLVDAMIVTYNCAAVDMLFGFFKAPANVISTAAYVALYSNGTSYLGFKPAPSYFQMGQWSKYVKRGAVRIAGASTNPSVKVSAFIQNGKKVIVLIHSGQTSESFAIPAGSYRAVRTQMSGSDRLTDKGLFSTAITLPRMSVTTLVER